MKPARHRLATAGPGPGPGFGPGPEAGPPRLHGRASAAGFTLAEVLVAVALMGLTVLAVGPLFAYAIRVTATGADLGSVGAVAVDRMEVLREADFFALAAGGSLSTNVSGYSDTSSTAFTVRWQITDNGTPSTLKTISVRVIAARRSTGLPKETTLSMVRAR